MKVNVVYVTYMPDIELLKKSIKSISNQINVVYVVDNTPDRSLALKELEKDNVKIIFLDDNFGIAYAQNIGIKQSLKDEVDYIMLSDQDTVYPTDYIDEMIKVFKFKSNVAAVTPKFFDKISNKPAKFIGVSPIIFKRFNRENGIHEVMHAIASGKILNAKYLEHIGLMKEELFIDWVDLEWCWRARKNGYKILSSADVLIQHQLGDNSKNIGFRDVNLRSPIRHYYIIRNNTYLSLRDKNLDFFHKITLFLKSFRYLVGYPILSKPHLTHLKYVSLGFYHGLIGKLGKLNDKN